MKIFRYALVCGLLISCVIPSLLFAEDEITFGSTPWISPGKLYQIYAPLTQYLESRLNKKVRFYVAKNYSELTEAIKSESVDFAHLSPNAYVQTCKVLSDLKYLVTIQKQDVAGTLQSYYSGVIIAAQSSSYTSLHQLKGKRFGFTDIQSTSGYLYPRAFLLKQGIIPESFFSRIFMLKKHDKVMAAIAHNSIDGGVLSASVFSTEKDKYDEVFRVLAETAKIPYAAYAARPGLPDVLCRELQSLFTSLTPDSEVIQTMKKHGFYGDGYIIIGDHFYDGVRKMNHYMNSVSNN